MKDQKPTKSELEILSVLWEKDGATVREVFDSLGSEARGGYTTVLKLMQIMHEKGLVERDETNRAHVYFPRIERNEAASGLIGEVVEKLFGGSRAKLVQQLLDDEAISTSEIEEIKKLIQNAREKESKS